jgi:hypothetical protein
VLSYTSPQLHPPPRLFRQTTKQEIILKDVLREGEVKDVLIQKIIGITMYGVP